MKRYTRIPVVAAAAGRSLGCRSLPASPATRPPTTPAFSGYSAAASATPVKVEIYEPTIPIPADPAGSRSSFGYTKVKADTGSTQGRASFLWPGDAVGEGLKTFVEQLGLPDRSSVENGYPVQVNSQLPVRHRRGRPTSRSPAPSMRTDVERGHGPRAGRLLARLQRSATAPATTGRRPGTPAAPALPGLPGVPLLDDLGDILGGARPSAEQLGQATPGALAGRQAPRRRPRPSPADADACQLPAELAALVDVERLRRRQPVRRGPTPWSPRPRGPRSATSRLLGGVVTMSGITVDGRLQPATARRGQAKGGPTTAR